MKMNMYEWVDSLNHCGPKKSLPVLTFPSVQLMDVSVRELISDSKLQAKGMSDDEISAKTGIKWGERKNMGCTRSLQDPLYAGDDGSIIEFGDTIADPNAETAEEICDKIDEAEKLEKVYARLRTMDPKDVLLTVSDCGYLENDPTLAELCGIAGLETPSGVKKKRDRIRAELRSSVYRSYNNLPLAG